MAPQRNAAKPPSAETAKPLIGVRVFFPEAEMPKRLKVAGATWLADRKLWILPLQDAVLRLRRDSSSLPVHRGSKQPKVLAPSQDVRDAVIISRRASLWLHD